MASRSLSGGGGKPSCPSPSAGDLRELPGVPLRGEAPCRGRTCSGLCGNKNNSSVAFKPASWRYHSNTAKSYSGTNPNSKLTKFLAVSQSPLSVVSINQFPKASSILGQLKT